MLIHRRLIPVLIGVVLATGGLAGCAKGPLWRTGYVAPWALKRWAEDESYAETLIAKRENLRSMVRTAARGAPADQENAAKQLQKLIETSPVRLERIEAVQLLGKLDAPTAEAALLQAAKDPSSEVRLAAIYACGAKDNPASLRALQEILGGDTDIDVRLAAARQIQNFHDPAAVQALALALDDPNPALQVRAADSMQVVTGERLGRDIQAWREYAKARLPATAPETQVAEQPTDQPLTR